MSVLVNCKEMALMKAFDDSSKTGDDRVNHSLIELQQTIIRFIQRTPGNDHCCDCNSQNGNGLIAFCLFSLNYITPFFVQMLHGFQQILA